MISFLKNPFFVPRSNISDELEKIGNDISGLLLDIGCGTKPYKKYFIHVEKYIGMEIEDPKIQRNNLADIYYDGKKIPFENDSLNCVFFSQVFEHVFNPNEFLGEVNRVLKNHGTLIITVPFLWPEHEKPFDYGRYSSYGINQIIKNHGFEIKYQKKSITGFAAIIQLIFAFNAEKISLIKFSIIRKILTLINSVVGNSIVFVFDKVRFYKNENYFIDNILVAEKYE